MTITGHEIYIKRIAALEQERDQLRQVLDEAGITVEITDTGIRWSRK